MRSKPCNSLSHNLIAACNCPLWESNSYIIHLQTYVSSIVKDRLKWREAVSECRVCSCLSKAMLRGALHDTNNMHSSCTRHALTVLVHALVRNLLTHLRGSFLTAEEFRRSAALSYSRSCHAHAMPMPCNKSIGQLIENL